MASTSTLFTPPTTPTPHMRQPLLPSVILSLATPIQSPVDCPPPYWPAPAVPYRDDPTSVPSLPPPPYYAPSDVDVEGGVQPYDDAAKALLPVASMPLVVRGAFVRNVLIILLVHTALIRASISILPSPSAFFSDAWKLGPWALMLPAAASIFLCQVLFYHRFGRIYTIFLLTSFMTNSAWIVTAGLSHFSNESTLSALNAIVAVLFGLTVSTCQHELEFYRYPGLIGAVTLFLTFIGGLLVPDTFTSHLVPFFISALLSTSFCMFVTWDLEQWTENMRAEEYVPAAMALYGDPFRLLADGLAAFNCQDAYGC